MYLVRDALHLGLPVYVSCTGCHAPSRRLELDALPPELDLEAAAAAGRFKCSSCGSRKARLMPVLAVLIESRRRLQVRCINCGRDRAYTAREACETFGIDTPFDELRVRVRCPSPRCGMSAGAMLPESEAPPAPAPRGKRRGGPLPV